MSSTSTTVEIPAAAVEQLAQERAKAEQAAQRASVEATPATPTPTPTKPAAPPEPLDPCAHAAGIAELASALGDVGGREVPGKKVAIVAHLTYPAANKYRDEIPYFVEILAIAGIAILVREAFFAKDAAPAADEKTTDTKPARKAA